MNKNKQKHPTIWAFTTYFAEGFPYTIIRQVSSLFLRDRGVALESIGLTSLFGLPWILKFLWAPLTDRYGTKKQWMVSMQAILAILFTITTLLAPLSFAPAAIGILFFTAAFFAATNDIAIDGYYMETLDKEGQAAFVGYRVMAYRIAMIIGTGLIATIGTTIGWFAAFGTASFLFISTTIFHYFYLEDKEVSELSLLLIWKPFANIATVLKTVLTASLILFIKISIESETYASLKETYPLLKKIYFSHIIGLSLLGALFILFLVRKKIKRSLQNKPNSFYAKAFLSFIDRKKIGVIFAAIIFLRTGEYMLSTMVAPFFVDLGIKIHYGWISGTVGLILSIAGALVGGALIKKFTFKKVLWPFLFLQNFSNLVYMALALILSKWLTMNTGVESVQSIGTFNIGLVTLVQGFDQFAGGLGTAVLTILLMRLCHKQFKAAHFAIGTAFMTISGVIAGVFGGILAEAYGYAWFFGISFLFSIPGMIAVLFLPNYLIKEE